MSPELEQREPPRSFPIAPVWPLAVAVGLAACWLASRPFWLLAGAATALYLLLAFVSLRRPLIFVTVFLVTVIVFPPFYFSRFGETPVYVSTLLLPIGLAVALARFPDFKFHFDPVAKGLALFLAGTGISLPFAWWFSGSLVATQSVLRWLMLAQSALIYFLVRGARPARESRAERRLVPILMVAAVISAAYGIADFYWPVPLPHPAADQYIWLQNAVIRRAQGVFYEASNLANLCGFFLAAASAAFLAREKDAVGWPGAWLLLFIAVLGLGVFVAFSRSAWANVLVTLAVFVAISRQVKLRRAVAFLAALAVPVSALWAYSPELWNYFLRARVGIFSQIIVDPNFVSSGRFETWRRVLSILEDYPHYLVFGVGYKTLPYTRLFHGEIITDNGYLNLLLETGIAGLASFVVFSAAVLKTFLKLARKTAGVAAFWGALLFSFWCGEWVMMLAADAYTYWRNMAVFLALMAWTLNRAERETAAEHDPDDRAPQNLAGKPVEP